MIQRMMGFGVTLTGRIGRESQRSRERVNLNWCGGSWGAQALRPPPRSRLGCTLWAAPRGLHSKAACCAADTGRKCGSPAWRFPRELRVSRGFGPKPKLWTGPEVHAGSRGEPLWRRGRWDGGAEGAPRGLRRPRVRSLGLESVSSVRGAAQGRARSGAAWAQLPRCPHAKLQRPELPSGGHTRAPRRWRGPRDAWVLLQASPAGRLWFSLGPCSVPASLEVSHVLGDCPQGVVEMAVSAIGCGGRSWHVLESEANRYHTLALEN